MVRLLINCKIITWVNSAVNTTIRVVLYFRLIDLHYGPHGTFPIGVSEQVCRSWWVHHSTLFFLCDSFSSLTMRLWFGLVKIFLGLYGIVVSTSSFRLLHSRS